MMKQYYYLDGQQQFGPLSKEELQGKNITKETLVWYEGLSEWTKAGEVEDLADLFPNIPTPPPIPDAKTIASPPINMPKKKKTKKVILICLGLLVIVAFVAVCLFINQLNSEKRCPTCYLDITHKEVTNITWSNVKLEGVISNRTYFTGYRNIILHVNFFDKDRNVIKSDDYILPDYYWRGSRSFEINIDLPKGLKNKMIGLMVKMRPKIRIIN